ncbi:hypothetical protein [Corallococcus terminator]|uniref:hypothetical protein n=1 Tax=Corallococcus terminator TaxID=2316733 RepID=UPI00131596C4|nr:hypothetical protein [Corallococcus terminator]
MFNVDLPITNADPWLAGKTGDRTLVSDDQPAASGDSRGFIDDLVVTNGPLP